MHVKPARGMQIPDPDLRDFLPAEGREVVPSEYWTRRLADGDVRKVEPPAQPAAARAPKE